MAPESASDDAQVGERIRATRIMRGVSQAELAAVAHVSASYISMIEHGRRPATAPVLRAIGGHLDVSVDFLASGHDAVDEDPDTEPSVDAYVDGPSHSRPGDLELDVRFAELALRHGDIELAEERFRSVVNSESESPSEWLFAAKHGLARTLEARGRLEDAIKAYESLLTDASTAAEFGDHRYVQVVIALCRIYRECGDLSRAVELGELAMSMLPDQPSANPEVGESEVALVSTLAGCYFERGDLTRAHVLAESALGRAQAAGLPLARAAAYWNAALIAEARGEAVAARRFVDRARAIYAESDNVRAVALLKLVTAWLILRDDKPNLPNAEELLVSALDDLPVVGTQVDIAYGEIELARAKMLGGDWAEAIRLSETSIERLGDGARLQGARARLTLGQARLMGGDRSGALETFAMAAKELRSLGADRQAGEAWRELAEMLVRMGRAEEALEAYREAANAAGLTVSAKQFEVLDAAWRRPG